MTNFAFKKNNNFHFERPELQKPNERDQQNKTNITLGW